MFLPIYKDQSKVIQEYINSKNIVAVIFDYINKNISVYVHYENYIDIIDDELEFIEANVIDYEDYNEKEKISYVEIDLDYRLHYEEYRVLKDYNDFRALLTVNKINELQKEALEICNDTKIDTENIYSGAYHVNDSIPILINKNFVTSIYLDKYNVSRISLSVGLCLPVDFPFKAIAHYMEFGHF